MAGAVDPGQVEPTQPSPAPEGETPTSEVQGGQTGEFDWTSVEVEVAGRTMRAGDVVKSYGEAEKAMRQAQNAKAQADDKLKQYGWADDFRAVYQSNPAFAQAVDAAYNEAQGNAPNAAATASYQPHVQELDNLKAQMYHMQHKADIAEMRAAGYNISGGDEQEILTHIIAGRALNPRDAYSMLFRERDIEAARRDSTANTADHMRKSQGAYDEPPKGSQTPVKKSAGEMSQAEADDALMADIEKMDMFKR